MSSRRVFLGHGLLVIAMGMSESYSWLAWGQLLILISFPMLLANLAFPFQVLFSAKREQRTPERILFAVMLSTALSVAGFVAIVPPCT